MCHLKSGPDVERPEILCKCGKAEDVLVPVSMLRAMDEKDMVRIMVANCRHEVESILLKYQQG